VKRIEKQYLKTGGANIKAVEIIANPSANMMQQEALVF
jgi:hypothetical protein